MRYLGDLQIQIAETPKLDVCPQLVQETKCLRLGIVTIISGNLMADKAVRLAIKNLMRLAFAAAALFAYSGPFSLAQTSSEVIARTPKKIYEFVPYCTGHLNDCRSMVDLIANELLSEGQPHICVVKFKDNEIATKSIISWLVRREETHAMSTNIGLRTAINVLWHC